MILPVRYRSAVGKPRISVTQVLTIAGRIDRTWFTEESVRRGSIVHAATESYDRGEIMDVPPELMGYVEAYATFLAVVKPIYVASELEVQSEPWNLGGRIDRECVDFFGDPGIVDFKTGPFYPWHGDQLAAYNAMHRVGARWTVQLSSNGSYRLKRHDDPQDYRRFFYDLARVQLRVYPDGDYWRVKPAV